MFESTRDNRKAFRTKYPIQLLKEQIQLLDMRNATPSILREKQTENFSQTTKQKIKYRNSLFKLFSMYVQVGQNQKM